MPFILNLNLGFELWSDDVSLKFVCTLPSYFNWKMASDTEQS